MHCQIRHRGFAGAQTEGGFKAREAVLATTQFLGSLSPRSAKLSFNRSGTCSCTAPERQKPPGSLTASGRAATY